MEINLLGILFIGAILCFALASILGLFTPREAASAKPHRSRRTADEDDDDEYESDWDVVDFPNDGDTRPAGYVMAPGGNNVNIAGFNHSSNYGRAFLKRATKQLRLELQREPKNSFDKNAIMVMGIPLMGAPPMKLGYLPATLAKTIAEQFLPEMPLHAEPRRAGEIDGGEAIFMAINVLMPPMKHRKQFIREGH